MKYQPPESEIPSAQRETVNKKLLSLIYSGNMRGITQQDVFQAYTGDGGLHGLNRNGFSSYHQYSEAKKEVEQGQFFTPAQLCKEIVRCIDFKPHDLVADLTFGMGNFFNFLPTESNCYGTELDAKASRVAQFLYPEANLSTGDIRFYEPRTKFDTIIGNPPFNLRWEVGRDSVLSQLYFMEKSASLLVPGGLLVFIAPSSFLADAFMDKHAIESADYNFSFLAQSKLPKNAFVSMGVKSFDTKVLFFQRKGEGITGCSFNPGAMVAFKPDAIRAITDRALAEKHASRHKILYHVSLGNSTNNWSFKDIAQRNGEGYAFQVRKLLYEINSHPPSKAKYSRAQLLVEQLATQVRPDGMKEDEWQKIKLSEGKVLAQLRRILRDSLSPKRETPGIFASKVKNGLLIRANGREAQRLLEGSKVFLPFYDICTKKCPFNGGRFGSFVAPYIKLVEKKRRGHFAQLEPMESIQPPADALRRIGAFTFVHKDGNQYTLTDKQSTDIGKMLSKPFGGLLNWQQGAGKTVGAWAVHKLHGGRFKNTVIVGPPIAIEMTWVPFIKRQGEQARLITGQGDFKNIKEGEVVLMAHTMAVKLQRWVKRFMKSVSNKILLIVDESDEISNYRSGRSHTIRDAFRRSRYTLLTTGTPTRNNAAEIYGQYELIHNNSINMICAVDRIHKEIRTKEDGLKIVSELNERVGKPFPARGGFELFKSSFSPTKSTVFGIGKFNQDVYNTETFKSMISGFLITRTFSELAGPGKYEMHTTTVAQTGWELGFYKQILEEFNTLMPKYYSSTGSHRKDAMLRIMLQIKTLINACSFPHIMMGHMLPPAKALAISNTIFEKLQNKRVMLGTISVKAARFYAWYLQQLMPGRPVYLITGGTSSFKQRQRTIDEFEATKEGILVSTQMSLSSSVNVPSCDEVIVEALQWNQPKIFQYVFRAIRFDSLNKTNVRFFVYENSIEVNLLNLLVDKERINDFIKTKQVRSTEDVFSDFNLTMNFLEMLIEKTRDKEGKVQIKWGKQKFAA